MENDKRTKYNKNRQKPNLNRNLIEMKVTTTREYSRNTNQSYIFFKQQTHKQNNNKKKQKQQEIISNKLQEIKNTKSQKQNLTKYKNQTYKKEMNNQPQGEFDRKEYDLLKSINEEKQLLQKNTSTTSNKNNNNESLNSSQCDQPIQLSETNLEIPTEELKLYNGVQSKNLNNNEFIDENELLERIKRYSKSISDLFKYRREYDSYLQLYTQISFDGIILYNIMKQTKIAHDSLRQSRIEYRHNINYKALLEKRPLQPLQYISQVNNICFRGQIKIKQNNSDQNKQYYLIGDNNKEISLQLNKNVEFKQQNNLSKQFQYSKSYLVLGTSSLATFLSKKNLFETELNIDNDFIAGQNYYFFGKHVQLNGELVLEINKIFKEFNLKKFNIESILYLITTLVSAGVTIYFALKFIKNIRFLLKKKKFFKRKQ